MDVGGKNLGREMKVYFHPDFYVQYTADPAAETGRMEVVVDAVAAQTDLLSFPPAMEEDLRAVHSRSHIERIRRLGLYDIAALAAGGAIQAAESGMNAPSFAIIS